MVYKTSVTNVDTDDDGLSDGLEVHVLVTDPTKKDTDGVSDGLEAAASGFNANILAAGELAFSKCPQSGSQIRQNVGGPQI